MMDRQLKLKPTALFSMVVCCVQISSAFTPMGSTTESADACEVGTELQDSLCVPCPRGFFRGAEQKACQTCPGNFTTAGTGSTSPSHCDQVACGPGYFRNVTRNECQVCDYGFFQPEKWQDSCLHCPAHYTTERTGSTSVDQCLFFCPAGEENLIGTSCTVCPRGYFRTDSLDDRFLPCTACNATFTTPATGAKSPDDCNIKVCLAGFYRNVTVNVCYLCPLGSYQPDDLQSLCLPCPDQTTTARTGSVNLSECLFYCAAGYEVLSAETQSCTPCARGFFKTNDGDDKFGPCVRCPDPSFTTDHEASDSPDLCSVPVCDAGQETMDGECVDCYAGSYQPVDGPRTVDRCQQCPNGTGTPTTKQTSQSACQVVCAPGEEFDGALSACRPCPMGTWNSGNVTQRFQPCTSCPAGYVTSGEMTGATHPDQCTLRDCLAGEFTDGPDCTPCPMGYYQNVPRQTTCKECPAHTNTSGTGHDDLSDCRIHCPAGETQDPAANDTCIPCEADFVKSDMGYGECEQCHGNFTSSTDRTECSVPYCDRGYEYDGSGTCRPCEVGTYKETRGDQQDCFPCPANTTTIGPASTSPSQCDTAYCDLGFFSPDGYFPCLACPMGQYKDSPGNHNCTACASDFTTSGLASTAVSDCVVVCPEGHYSLSRTTCQQCPQGQFQSLSGSMSCESCAQGTTTLQSASASAQDCIPICDKGQYLDTDLKLCVDCALGTYNPEAGTATAVFMSCLSCRDGFTTASTGSDSEDQCNIEDCRPGSFRSEGVGCQQCPLGSFQPQESQSSCTPCPSGQTTLVTGRKNATSCVTDCPDGQQYNFQSGACDLCPIGFYRLAAVTSGCVMCPPGLTTVQAGQGSCIEASDGFQPRIPQSITVTVSLRLHIGVCTNQNQVGNVIIDFIFSVFFRTAERFPGLCDAQCSNLQVSFQTGCLEGFTREKRDTDSQQEVDAILNGIYDVIADHQTGRFHQSVVEIRNAFYDIQPEQSMLLLVVCAQDQNLMTFLGVDNATYVAECQPGQQRHGSECHVCVAGTFSADGVDCWPCALDSYQGDTGQNSCLPCPDNTFTWATGSTHVTDCIPSPSDVTTTAGGVDDGSDDDELKTMAGVVSGAVTFLLVLVLVVCVVGYRRRRANKNAGSGVSRPAPGSADARADDSATHAEMDNKSTRRSAVTYMNAAAISVPDLFPHDRGARSPSRTLASSQTTDRGLRSAGSGDADDVSTTYAEIDDSRIESYSDRSAGRYMNATGASLTRQQHHSSSRAHVPNRMAGNGTRGTSDSGDAHADDASAYTEISSYAEIDDRSVQDYSGGSAVTYINTSPAANQGVPDSYSRRAR